MTETHHLSCHPLPPRVRIHKKLKLELCWNSNSGTLVDEVGAQEASQLLCHKHLPGNLFLISVYHPCPSGTPPLCVQSPGYAWLNIEGSEHSGEPSDTSSVVLHSNHNEVSKLRVAITMGYALLILICIILKCLHQNKLIV